MQLLEVQNLIFVLPLVAAFLFILLMAFGIPLGDHGVHMDIGHAHVDVGDGVHADVSPGALGSVLSFLGVGRVPLAVTIIAVAMIWGVAGLVMNQLSHFDRIWTPIGLAAAASVIGTRWVSVGLARLLPSVETYYVSAADLVRHQAEVIHDVSPEGGTVRLTDRLGNLRDVTVRAKPGQRRISRGERVLLTEYDEQAGVFHAESLTA